MTTFSGDLAACNIVATLFSCQVVAVSGRFAGNLWRLILQQKNVA